MVRDMTRKQKRVKTYLAEHPEILEGIKIELSEYSFGQIDDADIPDFQEFLSRKNGMAKYFKTPDSHHNNIPYHFSKTWYRRIGVVIPLAFILLAFFFMAFTTTGKALAEDIYRTIIHWFDDSVNIQYGPDNAPYETPGATARYFDSFSEIEVLLKIETAQNNQAVLYDKIKVEQTKDDVIIIRSNYISGFNEFDVTQTSIHGKTVWNSNLQYPEGQIIDETVGGMRFVGYILDHHAYAIAYTEEMSVQIIAEEIDYDSFISFIKCMNIA